MVTFCSSLFTYVSGAKTFISELSTLQNSASGDVSVRSFGEFRIKSEKTGREVTFTFVRDERGMNNELISLIYCSSDIAPDVSDLYVQIFND